MFKIFKKNKEPKNLKDILREFEELKKEVRKLRSREVFSFQKIGIIRYNPFSDVGGNQSFSVALLDGKKSGIVITGLYGKEGSRVYAKAIKNGRSDYSLSGEEKKAVQEALASSSLSFSRD